VIAFHGFPTACAAQAPWPILATGVGWAEGPKRLSVVLRCGNTSRPAASPVIDAEGLEKRERHGRQDGA
jgi:hypothetical protein